VPEPATEPPDDGLAAALLAWAGAARRDLPWRATRDPWEVLVAEVMLQQTQVDRVVPRWRSFLRRWPDTSTCAAAPVADVLREWQGLGYPRRARWLHATATAIEQRHGGRFPDRLEELLALDGVGPYTARAVLAFAFERDVAVLDTNVGRVLARWEGRPLARAVAQSLADRLVPAGEGWAWNQGVLDLGATVCRPRPDCGRCPVRHWCAWQRAGRPDPDPAVGSAAVSRPQARYEGSRRQARGRLLAALAEGPVALDAVAAVVGRDDRDPAEARSVVESLVADGLAELGDDGRVRLPG
jgi:A/G-specific adenine glycosylase